MEQRVSRKEVRKLPCQLTPDEVRLRGIDLANSNTAYADLEDEKKRVVRDMGERLKAINSTIHELKDAVRHGVEVREVDCDVTIDRYLGKATITRTDSGEVVEVRPLTPREAQGEMDFEER